MLNGYLAIGNFDINIWNITNGTLVKTLSGHSCSEIKLALLKNGLLVSGCSYGDGFIKIWNTENGSVIRNITDYRGVSSFAVLQNGFLAKFGFYSSLLEIINPDSGKLIQSIYIEISHKKCIWYLSIYAFTVLPNGNLVIGDDCGSLHIYNTQNNSLMKRRISYLHDYFTSLVVLQNGNLASGSSSGIRIWNTNTGELIKKVISSGIYLAELPNGFLVGAGDDLKIKIWNMETESLVFTIRGHNTGSIWYLAVLNNGNLVSASYAETTTKIWSLNINNSLISTSSTTTISPESCNFFFKKKFFAFIF